MLAIVAGAAIVCALVISTARLDAPAELATDRGAAARVLEMHMRKGQTRLLELAAVPGDPDCVSWRGCAGSYEEDSMNLNNPDTPFPDLGQGQSFYDRFDNYPTAWDSSPGAQYVRDLYPGGYPAFAHEEPAVIVGGDTTKAYPFQDFGSSWGGGYENYRTPYTYTY